MKRRLMVAGVFMGVFSLGTAAWGTSSVTANRLAGADRYGTAAAIATSTFGSAKNAVVASGANFPDALAAAYLAGLDRGPVLLTDPDNLSPDAANALHSLGIQGVQVVGGAGAVSDNVVSQLQNAGYVVDRIWGDNREGTAAAIANAGGTSPVASFPGHGKTGILATAAGFADALSAGPIAYAKNFPILLTDPNTLSPETQSMIHQLGITYMLIFGGTAAISSNVENQLNAMGVTDQRVAGGTRQDTAVAAAGVEQGSLGFGNTHVTLARGDLFPDALAGGPHAGAGAMPIVLTNTPTDLSAATTRFLQSESSTIGTIDALGGGLAIADATLQAAVNAAQGH